jgi:diacylglycerol kinase (ATP)
MQISVIGNPVAGKGRAERRICDFVRILERHGHVCDVFMTSSPGDAYCRAASLSSRTDRLVVAGGDGTVNEVLNGLSDPSQVPILHLPTGTANQLALTLGLPSDLKRLVGILEQGIIRRVDLGTVGDRRFLLLATAGFDARVAEETTKRRNGTLGYSGYVVPIIKTLASHRAEEMTIVIDGEQSVTGYNVMVLKVSRYGGLFRFGESADLDSGLFEVCVFRNGSTAWLFRYALSGLLRTPSDMPGVIRLNARSSVCIESEVPVPVQIDGDPLGMTPVKMHLHPALVPVVVDDPFEGRQNGSPRIAP